MPPPSLLHALVLGIAWFVSALAMATTDAESAPGRVDIPRMRTTIYVGSVSLETTTFVREGERWSASYDARVFPWAFWSEHGSIAIRLPETEYTRLLRGEAVEFTGDAKNHRGKPREVTGRATPEGSTAGKIKVRIRVDGAELVFNGSYALAVAP